jgi:hypothetical protein
MVATAEIADRVAVKPLALLRHDPALLGSGSPCCDQRVL